LRSSFGILTLILTLGWWRKGMRRWTLKIPAGRALVVLAVVLAAPPLPQAQQTGSPAQQAGSDQQLFKPEELEQIVAPIALYPDPLVAQVLMASTYPLEVVQAARFAKANPNLKDAALSEELKKHDWDDSVKSLVSFPQILDMMNEKLDWMQKLGDAFLGQQKATMDAIQRLRARAQASGNLQSNEQQKVIVEPAEAAQPAPPSQSPPSAQPTVIKIEPANPQVVYVPTYNPTVVYGAWPYPAYPPYYYYPPGYAAATAVVSFGVGMAVGAAVWGGCNWGHGDVDVDVNKYNNFTRNNNVSTKANQIKTDRASGQGGSGNRQSWQHSPEHRKGAQYRDSATQQKFNRGSSPQAASREEFRGRAEQGRQDLSRGGAGHGGAGAARTREGGVGSAGGAQHGGRDAGAFEGMGHGREQHAYSQRGQSSRDTSRAGGYSGGGSRGGGAAHAGGARGGGGGRGGGGRGGGRR
jgi:Protein of unknown function (DUF3300)